MSDGMTYHWQTRALLDGGANPFLWHPLSFFGMYPFSSPSGPQTTIAALAVSTGLDISPLIVFHDMFLGVVSIGSMFMLSLVFKRNTFFAFFSTLIYNTHWYYLNQTIWFLTLRGHIIAFLPFLLWAFIRYFRILESNQLSARLSLRMLFIFLASYIIAMSSHRMIAFIIPTLLVPLLLVKIIYSKNIRNRLQILKNGRPISVTLVVLSLLVFSSAVYFGDSFEAIGLPSFEPHGVEFHKYPYFGILNPLVNLGATYVVKGILQFFSIIGLLAITLSKFRYKGELSLLIIALFQARFMVDIDYFMPIASLFIALLGGIGIWHLFKLVGSSKSFAWQPVFIVSLLVVSATYTSYLKKINTSVEDIDMRDIVIGQGLPPESWDGSYWVASYVTSDSAIMFTDSRSALTLLLSKDYRNFYTASIIMHDDETRDRLEVEPYSFFNIFFHQKPRNIGIDTYGAKVWDPAFTTFGAGNEVEQTPVDMGFYYRHTLHDSSRGNLVITAYEMNYVVIGNWPGQTEDNSFFAKVQENNFRVYQNEIMTFLSYRHNYE